MSTPSLRPTTIRAALFTLIGLLCPFALWAQTPVIEATNSSDALLFQVFDDGGLLSVDPANTGTIPVEGSGTRLMWYPERYAFRAGSVDGPHWDADSIGTGSVAFGRNTTATAFGAFAAGTNASARGRDAIAFGSSEANGGSSIAMGTGSIARGTQSIALGDAAETNDRYAVALGAQAKAKSYSGIAIGWKASTGTANQGGIVMNADYTASGDGPSLVTTDQFAARARHFWFGDDNNITYNTGRLLDTSTGAYLTDGGTWTNSSDATKKEQYRPVDGEALLRTLHGVPVRTWSYKNEADAIRHMGPTAQDFHAAFGLGDSNTAISTVDIDGVNMAAIQALAARTEALQSENEALEARVARLERLVETRSSLPAGLGGPLGMSLLVLVVLGGGAVVWRMRAAQA